MTHTTADETAAAFVDATDRWTSHTVVTDAVAPFDGLGHDTHERGAILVWRLDDQPAQYV